MKYSFQNFLHQWNDTVKNEYVYEYEIINGRPRPDIVMKSVVEKEAEVLYNHIKNTNYFSEIMMGLDTRDLSDLKSEIMSDVENIDIDNKKEIMSILKNFEDGNEKIRSERVRIEKIIKSIIPAIGEKNGALQKWQAEYNKLNSEVNELKQVWGSVEEEKNRIQGEMDELSSQYDVKKREFSEAERVAPDLETKRAMDLDFDMAFANYIYDGNDEKFAERREWAKEKWGSCGETFANYAELSHDLLKLSRDVGQHNSILAQLGNNLSEIEKNIVDRREKRQKAVQNGRAVEKSLGDSMKLLEIFQKLERVGMLQEEANVRALSQYACEDRGESVFQVDDSENEH